MFGRRELFSVAFAVLLVSAGCGGESDDSPTAPTTPPPTGPSELQIVELTEGTGQAATATSSVFIIYTLWHYDPAGTDGKGGQIATNVGGQPLSLTLTTGTITGMTQGMTGMKVGGKRRLTIPPSLAYGSTGTTDGQVRPNEWVVFEVELLATT